MGRNFSKLQKLLDSFLELGIPGTGCEVWHEGQPAFRYYNGMADREAGIPVDEKTFWKYFSVSKVFTCTAALQLFEQGRFLLSDPLSWYLPEFADMQVSLGDGRIRPAERPILIRDLFTMTAGLTYNLGTARIREGIRETSGLAPTREMMKYLAKDPLSFDPGEAWQYSLCHDVLGALVEVLSGQNFDAYLREHVLAPADVEEITFHPSEEQQLRMARIYDYDWEHRTSTIPEREMNLSVGPAYESGGAGLCGTTEACAKFGEALISGKLLSLGTVDLMRTNFLNDEQLEMFQRGREPGVRRSVDRAGYGYGLGVRTMIDLAEGGSNGSLGEFGWGGALGAYLLLDPARQLVLFYAQSTMRPPAEYTRSRLRNVLYACVD